MSDVVASQVLRHRKRLGWRRVDLAERCAAIGWPQLTEPAIGYLETGRRDATGRRRREVTIDELMVLARALDVAPVLLVAPVGNLASVEVVPGFDVPTSRAVAWLTHQQADLSISRPAVTSPDAGLVIDAEVHEVLVAQLRDSIRQITRKSSTDRRDWRLAARLFKDLKDRRDRLGEVPPLLPDDLAWVDRVEAPERSNWSDWYFHEDVELPTGFRPGEPPAWEVAGDAPVVE